MTTHQSAKQASGALLEVSHLNLCTPIGRPLFCDLNIVLGRDMVALIGRNGVGKSTLLEILAGNEEPREGKLVLRTRPLLVRQDLASEGLALVRRMLHDSDDALSGECAEAGLQPPAALAARVDFSRGELRKLHLLAAKRAQPDLLLLDEPTQDMDAAGVKWLCRWLKGWSGGLIVVSHNRRLLRSFSHFFLVAESGCRYFPGTFDQLARELESQRAQKKYLRNLNALVEREEHHARVCRRRQRKKNVGRLRELARLTPRSRLNSKRSYAQVSQGKAARIRNDRITTVRDWVRASRRALTVTLPLRVCMPALPDDDGQHSIDVEGVSVVVGTRTLFEGVSLKVGRDRVAVVGPNGSGKTTLLRVALQQRAPTSGSAQALLHRIGSIAQGGVDWRLEESLLSRLAATSSARSLEELAALLVAHKFPLSLADRPLCSLSPGERVRAALICLMQRSPAVELLVLDEPTYSLDFVGVGALQEALLAWPGGLLVASHDQAFLDAIRVSRTLVLGKALSSPTGGSSPAEG